VVKKAILTNNILQYDDDDYDFSSLIYIVKHLKYMFFHCK